MGLRDRVEDGRVLLGGDALWKDPFCWVVLDTCACWITRSGNLWPEPKSGPWRLDV